MTEPIPLAAWMTRQRLVMLRWSSLTGRALTPDVVAVWAARYHAKRAVRMGRAA